VSEGVSLGVVVNTDCEHLALAQDKRGVEGSPGLHLALEGF
jgi:hypothetical protein